MLDTKQILIFVLLGLFIVALIAYIFYAVVFWNVRKSIDALYKDQERYKEFSMVSFSSSAKPLELLIKSNPKWASVTNYIRGYDQRYKSQLEKTYSLLRELQNFKSHFDLRFSRKNLAHIDKYYAKLDGWIKSFQKLTENSSVYQNNASKLTVDYRVLVDEITEFLKGHILPKYDSPVFKELLINISKGFVSSNAAYLNFQNDLFVRQMENLRQSIHLLLQYINKLYYLDKRASYVSFVIQEIEHLYKIEESEQNLRNSAKLVEIYRVIGESKNSMVKVKQSLHLLQFKDTETLLQQLTRVLEPLKKDLYNESEARNIVKWGSQFFTKSIELFKAEHEKLLSAIKEVQTIFVHDTLIKNRINDIKASLELIIKTISSMQSYHRDTDRNYRNLLQKMNVIIDATSTLKSDLDELVKTVDTKMSIYKNVMFKINDLKLKYEQLGEYINANQFVIYNPIYNEFLALRHDVIEKDRRLYVNYDDAIVNFDEFSQKANNVFIETIKVVVELATLKKMTEFSLRFLNKYRHENIEIEKHITDIEKIYREGQYKKSLQRCIDVLKIIKRSAEYFKINMS